MDQIEEGASMLTAVQGIIKNNAVFVQDADITPYNGRTVTIIINEHEAIGSKQDKSKFFEAVGKIDIDAGAVAELRE